jgi:hypothetical protein
VAALAAALEWNAIFREEELLPEHRGSGGGRQHRAS